MTLFRNKLKTDSNRLKNWDYSSEAVYFITIVTENRKCIFGSVENEKMILNKYGQIVENELLKSINIRKNWFFHNWVIMPNHIHLLIEIQENINVKVDLRTDTVEAHSSASNTTDINTVKPNIAETHSCAPLPTRKPNSISSFVAIFKSVTTKQINGKESIWQSNFHDHIVRNYKSFEVIYDYIKNNPRSWETDSINSNFQ